jgi:hypothetical protein
MLVAIDNMLGWEMDVDLPQEIEVALNLEIAQAQVAVTIHLIGYLQSVTFVHDPEV